jgi:hypothetical protein
MEFVALSHGCYLKDIRQEDCSQVEVETLWWSYYLVWKPSSKRGSRDQLCAVSSLPQTVGCYWLWCLSNQLLLAPTEIKPVYFLILSTLWALGKYCFVNLSSSTFSCKIFLYNFLSAVWASGVTCSQEYFSELQKKINKKNDVFDP